MGMEKVNIFQENHLGYALVHLVANIEHSKDTSPKEAPIIIPFQTRITTLSKQKFEQNTSSLNSTFTDYQPKVHTAQYTYKLITSKAYLRP